MELTILLITLMVILIIFKLNQQKYTKEGIPIIGNIPWLGCGLQLKKGGGKFLTEMRKKHGDIFLLYSGGNYLYFVFTESFYSKFYKGNEDEMGFYSGIRDDTSTFHFDTILGTRTDETPEEKEEVSAVAPIKNFIQDSTKFFTTTIEPHVNYFFRYALDKQGIKPEEGKAFTADLVEIGLYFSMGLGSTLLTSFDVASSHSYLRSAHQFTTNALQILTKPKSLAGKVKAKCQEARYQMREMIDNYLVNVEKDLENNFDEMMKTEKFRAFANFLLTNRYQSTNRKYNVDAAGYAIISMIFATTGNTSTSLSNTLLDILVFPETKKRVMEEVIRVIKNHPKNADVPKNGNFFKNGNYYYIDQEMVDSLEFIDCCLSETIRLKAPPVNVRKIQQDLLDDQNKVLIPKHSFVCTSPWVRHREERVYEEADLYNPDRFAKGIKQKRFSFLTFGQGRHHCLGKHFAYTLIKLVIAMLFLHYDMKVIDDQVSSRNKEPKIMWFGFGVLKPAAPVNVTFTPRDL